MSNLVVQNSNFQSGGLDTASTLIDQVDEIKAQHVNGPNSAIVQIETVLGSGPGLKGNVADLSTRLNQQMDPLGNLVPVGGIIMYGGSDEPPGWALCNGQALSRVNDANLFAKIGTFYGVGDGTSTFNVPFINGRIPMGVGTGAGNGSSGTGLPAGTALTAVARGDWKGSETHLLTGAESGTSIHTHGMDHDHAQRERNLNGGAGGGRTPDPVDNSIGSDGSIQAISDAFGTITTSGSSPNTTLATSNTNASSPHSIMPPVIGLNFLIRR